MSDNIENDSIDTGSRVESLQRKNTDLREEVTDLRQENAELHREIDNLHRALAELQINLHNQEP